MENEKLSQPVNFQIIQENHDNEIDLYGIWRILNEYKYYLMITIVLCVVIAFIYLFTLSPIYRTNAYLLPPAEASIVALNISDYRENKNHKEKGSGIYSPISVYQEYIKTFNAKGTQNLFLEQAGLPFEGCTGVAITTSVDKTINQYKGVASFSSDDAEFSAKCLNKYVDFTQRLTVENLKKEVAEKVSRKKRALSERIDILREVANKNKEEAIIILTEAIEIAEKLGLTQKTITNNRELYIVNPKDHLPYMQMKPSLSLQMEILYQKGVLALSLELDALKNRKNNDPYTPGLIQLEQEINYLDVQLNDLSNTVVNAIKIEQEASVPGAVKPKTKLILLLGLISGVLSGLFLIFVLTMLKKIREQSLDGQEAASI